MLSPKLETERGRRAKEMPYKHNGWTLTRVLNWWHCSRKDWQSTWIHVSELPALIKWSNQTGVAGALSSDWLDARLPR